MKLNDSSKALIIVTGAPGSGKSTTVDHMLEQGTSFLVFDIDWLAQAAGDLAKKNIYSDPGTWGPYDALWGEVLGSIYRNSRQAIFFTPNTPDDIKIEPQWCRGIRWLLLDCDDETREERLNCRTDWTAGRKSDALKDAAELRTYGLETIDTANSSAGNVASKVIGFAERF